MNNKYEFKDTKKQEKEAIGGGIVAIGSFAKKS